MEAAPNMPSSESAEKSLIYRLVAQWTTRSVAPLWSIPLVVQVPDASFAFTGRTLAFEDVLVAAADPQDTTPWSLSDVMRYPLKNVRALFGVSDDLQM
jgi:hypothetical protein